MLYSFLIVPMTNEYSISTYEKCYIALVPIETNAIFISTYEVLMLYSLVPID